MSLSESWLAGARDIVGDRLLLDPDALAPFSHDEFATDAFRTAPLAVAKPVDEKEVAALVRLCLREGVPLTTRGGGTGLAGGCIPCPGGIVLSMELQNRVIDADAKNHTITTPMAR